MNDWLTQLQKAFDEAVQESAEQMTEQLTEVSEQINQVVDGWVDESIEVIDRFEAAIAPGLDTFNEQVDSALDAGFNFFNQNIAPVVEEATAPITNTINPWLQNHPTCIGCKNYHGTAYGEEMLICGMHPYGPEVENACEDWESVWPVPEKMD